MSEYQTAAKSVVDVAQAQADEDYRAYQSWLANTQYTAEWNRTEQQRQSELAQNMIDKTMAAGYSAAYVVNNMPEAFKASGYDVDYLNAMASYYASQKKTSYSSGGGSSSRSSSGSGSYPSGSGTASGGDSSNKYYQSLKSMANKGTNASIMAASLRSFTASGSITGEQARRWASEFGLS